MTVVPRVAPETGSDGSRARARPRLVGELAVLVVLLVGYDWVRRLAAVRETVALAHGRAILHAEAGLHVHLERISNAWLTSHHHLTAALSVLAAAYVWRPDVYPRARNALVLTNVVGLVVYALYPTAPPRLLPHAGFFDAVTEVFGTPNAPSSDQYGALPSLHLAWATWVAVVGGTLVTRRVLRWALWLYPVLTGCVVVATANHYVVDVFTGVALGLAATWITGALPVGRRRAHPVEDDGGAEPRASETCA